MRPRCGKIAACLRLFLLCSCLAPVLTLLWTSAATAAPADRANMRVCVYDSPGFHEFADDGSVSGYAVEYLLDIAEFNGWRYTFVPDTFSGCLKRLSAGEADIMGGLQRGLIQRGFVYPKTPMGMGHLSLYTRVDEQRYTHTDLATFNGMRVGVLQNSAAAVDLQRYCQEHQLSLQHISFTDRSVMLAALHAGEVDAILFPSLSQENDLRVILRFAVRPFYFAMPPGREDLANAFDAAAEKLVMTDRSADEDIRHKYIRSIPDAAPVFSEDEKAFIAAAGVL